MRAAIAGAVATATAIGLSELIAGVLPGATSLVAAVGQSIIDRQPPGAKDLVVSLFGTNDKVAFELAIVAIALAIGAGLGVLAQRRPWIATVAFAAFGIVGLPRDPGHPGHRPRDLRGVGGGLGGRGAVGPRPPGTGATPSPGPPRRRRCPIGSAARSWSRPASSAAWRSPVASWAASSSTASET